SLSCVFENHVRVSIGEPQVPITVQVDLCASGNRPSPQAFWSSPSRLKMRTGGSEPLNTKIDPFPSAATERGRVQSFSPPGGEPKNVTSYLRFVVWPKLPATNATTNEIAQANFFIKTF